MEVVITDSLGTLLFRVSQAKPSLQKLLAISVDEDFTGFSFLISRLQNLTIAIVTCETWVMFWNVQKITSKVSPFNSFFSPWYHDSASWPTNFSTNVSTFDTQTSQFHSSFVHGEVLKRLHTSEALLAAKIWAADFGHQAVVPSMHFSSSSSFSSCLQTLAIK